MHNRTFEDKVKCLLILSLIAMGCGSGDKTNVGFKLGFANLRHALTQTGLPEEVHGIKVDVRIELNQDPIASTGCVSVDQDAAEKYSVNLFVPKGEDLTVLANGYSDTNCSQAPQWRGVARNVKVESGKDTTVQLYVVKGGLRLNPIRASMPYGRAFATASQLNDGSILIAGGFDSYVKLSAGRFRLKAACDALIYDPGKAKFTKTIAMSSCRGLHSAISLIDGSVLLIGGASYADLDLQSITRPLIRPNVDTLLSSYEHYDPTTSSFASQSVDRLRRAEPIVLRTGGIVLSMGGRTDNLRSDEIIIGTPNSNGSDSYDWSISENTLSTGRWGGKAVAIEDDILVVGGNQPGQPDIEIIDDNLESHLPTIQSTKEVNLAVTGHGLLSTDRYQIMVSGGINNYPDSNPSARYWLGDFQNGTLTLQDYSLNSARAYHVVLQVPGLSDAEAGIAIVGGLDEQLKANESLEWIAPGLGPQTLDDDLDIGCMGIAAAILPDGSALFIGGLSPTQSGGITLSPEGQILVP